MVHLVKLKKNQEYQKRAEAVIAHSALTNSKRPQSFVRGIYPTHFVSAHGAKVADVDGNTYVDYICGLGSQLFGHTDPSIQSAVSRQLLRGPMFSLGSALEVEVAELFQNQFCYLERVRFLKTASEACSAAVRIARVFTESYWVYSEGYHGWHDEFTSLTPPAKGVACGEWMQLLQPWDGFGNRLEGAAAVIVEPVITDWSEERINWLRKLRHETEKSGTLLIFDETITGLRFPGLSVAKHTGINPDLCVMGKSIAGGLPLALVGGRADVMSCDYFVSSTFAGDCLALSAARAVFGLINTPGVMELLQSRANKFCDKFNAIAPDLIKIEGYNTRGIFVGSDMNKALFMQECVKAGVLFGPAFFYGTEHHVHDDFTLGICKSVLNRIVNNEVKLEGEMPQKAYAQKVREK